MFELQFIVFVAIGASIGGFVNGIAGFGTGLFALSWWLLVLPPMTSVLLVVALSLVSGLQGVVAIKQNLNWLRLLRFLIPAFLGLPLGFLFLESINVQFLKVLVGVLLLFFGAFFAFRSNFPSLARDNNFGDMLTGFAGGVLGAVAGLSGALPTIWSSLHGWNKYEQRALLQPFNVTILGTIFICLLYKNPIHEQFLFALFISIPFSVLGSQLGIFTFKKLTDNQFRRLLVWLIFVSGIVLLIRETSDLIIPLI